IGFFVNTLALRVRLDADPDLRGLLAAVRNTALAAFAHQDLPFEALVEELRPERDLARNPLLQVMLTWKGAAPESADAGSEEALRLTPLRLAGPTTSKLDLLLEVEERVEEGRADLDLALEYATDLFSAATVARLLGHLEALLEAATADASRPV